MKKAVIVVAGGKGLRMQSDIPKQFLTVNGKPLLMYTLEAFFNYDPEIKLVLVLPLSQMDYWETLCKTYSFSLSHQIVAGGETRFHSVRNGLNVVDEESLIAVHDGVRPMVSVETIARCFDEALKAPAVVPVIDMVDSVRYVDNQDNHACDRSRYKLVQTPQVFNGAVLKKAYCQPYSDSFTDDASVVEGLGEKIKLVEGNRENIKITTSFDLVLAECLLRG